MSRIGDALAVVTDRLYQLRLQAGNLLRRDDPARLSQGSGAPVLLLPGVYETWEFLRPVAEQLNRLGHPIHTLEELGYNRRPIAASAELAGAYLESRDLRGVILIAHSKGGIIGKQLMVDDREGRVDRLIAVNSPFGGSSLARWAPNPALRAFRTTDETLRTLAANLEANSRITSVFSRFDPLIPGGSRLEGAANVELPLVGHFRPLASRLLLEEVERAIVTRGGPGR